MDLQKKGKEGLELVYEGPPGGGSQELLQIIWQKKACVNTWFKRESVGKFFLFKVVEEVSDRQGNIIVSACCGVINRGLLAKVFRFEISIGFLYTISRSVY